MTPPAEKSGQHETARQQSRAAWGAVARGWYAQREELWKASRPVSEWMVQRLDPQAGDTVLELAAGLADTGLMAARLVGESGGRIRELVVGAGFAEPEIEEVTFRWPFAEKDAYWRYVTETSASSLPVLRALSHEVQNTVREQVHEAARPYRSGEGYDFPAACLNAVTH
jgi:hypothetical protein